MNGEGISEGLSVERKVEIKVRKNGRKDEVIVEKSAAEGLPKGWIKKLVITNRSSGRKRRDPFFIDPKSEYVFHSFKAASRYVETGKIGNYARKFKESDTEDDDSGNGKTVVPLESVGKISADDLLEKEKKLNIHVRDSKRRNISSSDEHSEDCKMNSELSSVTSQVTEGSWKKEDAKAPIEMQPIPKRITRSQAKASKNEEDTVQSRMSRASSQDTVKDSVMKEEAVQSSPAKGITRSEAKVMKNEPSNSVARRASKRLAGIELEPTPELKTRTKSQRTVPPDDSLTPEIKSQRTVPPDDSLTPEIKTRTKAQLPVPPDDERTPELKTRAKAQRISPPDDGTAGKCKQPLNPVVTSGLKKTDIPLNKEVAKSYNVYPSQKPNGAAAISNNRLSAEMAVGIEKIGKPIGRNLFIDKKLMKTPLMISEAEELNPVFHLDGYKHKEEMSPVSPLSRQTSAIKSEKTAAGKRLARSSPKTKLTTSVKSSNKGKYPHPSDSGYAIQKSNKLGNELSNSSVVRGTCSEVMEKNTNSFSSAFDSTLADILKDPCIAFAIKTLTGESLRLPNTAAISSDPNNNQTKQKGVSFFTETSGNSNTSSAKPENSNESPGAADIWKDPCIDFAIKTLTGAIPIGLDDEPDAKKFKSEQMKNTTSAATQEAQGRQLNSCDYLAQQCNNKTVTKFTQSFSKD